MNYVPLSSIPPAIIGIDNGVSGALCALCPESGALLDHRVMPTREHYGKNEPDTEAVLRWLSGFDCRTIAIEDPPFHAPSASSLRSMTLCFGLLHGALEAAGFTVARVTVKQWQDAMLGKKRVSGTTKQIALKVASGLWPHADWRATAKSTTPHDGIIDAALIARYLVGYHRSKK